MPGIGDLLPIIIRLTSEDTSKIVRSTVRDQDGIEIPGSPFTLTHVGLGLYQINTVGMPDTAFVTVSHDIFNGPGFTNRDSKYFGDDAQYFIKDSFEDAVDDLKQAVRGVDLVAEIDDGGGLVAEIFEGETLDAIIEEDELIATIDDSDDLEATLETDETLEGEIDC